MFSMIPRLVPQQVAAMMAGLVVMLQGLRLNGVQHRALVLLLWDTGALCNLLIVAT